MPSASQTNRFFTVISISNFVFNTTLFISYLNDSNEAHIVVVAKDSGTPARETSVPVVVTFEERDGTYGRHLSGINGLEEDAVTLAICLGLVVILFFAVIMSLTVYICKNKVRNIASAKNNKTSPHGYLLSML